jgi:hypothetical protein
MMIDGDIFQPGPSSRAARAPVPSVDRQAWPFSPVKFSGLIERLRACDTRDKLPGKGPRPL